jgi:hypothetical protein
MEIQIETKLNKNILKNVLRMYDENFSPHVKIPHYKIKKRLDQKQYQLLSCKLSTGEWIGFCLVSTNINLSVIFIDYLCIDKPFQKGGFGKQILNAINDQDILDTEHQYKYTVLECEDYLIPYYVKNKYKKIPVPYPIDGSRPLFMLYRQRKTDATKPMIDMYHKFIFYGLLFNGEIIMCYGLFMMLYIKFLEFETLDIVKIIMNFKTTHT